MSEPLSIEVFSDPVCPWCLIGLARLDKAIAKLPATTSVRIIHRPFQLDPDAPEGGSDLVEHLTQKFGADPSAQWARLEQEALTTGIDLRMRRQKMRYPTLKAHALIRAAADKSTQHELAKAIGDAYFHAGKNINDADVLVAIATKFGFSETEAQSIVTDPKEAERSKTLAQAALANGIQGVPFFVFDQKYAMSGCQTQDTFDSALERIAAEHGDQLTV